MAFSNAPSKPCPHDIVPWFDCDECKKPQNHNMNWHFTHNGQWTLRRQELLDKAAVDPFGQDDKN